MDSYRAEKKAMMAIALPDANAEIEPVPRLRRWAQTGAGIGQALEHREAIQRPVWRAVSADSKAMEQRITGESSRPRWPPM
jgi:type I restriction enzyme R subunit